MVNNDLSNKIERIKSKRVISGSEFVEGNVGFSSSIENGLKSGKKHRMERRANHSDGIDISVEPSVGISSSVQEIPTQRRVETSGEGMSEEEEAVHSQAKTPQKTASKNSRAEKVDRFKYVRAKNETKECVILSSGNSEIMEELVRATVEVEKRSEPDLLKVDNEEDLVLE
ncbi:hypothetical protein QYF36_013059 [Acer negundo]|nr:hypothetical protein QYF36_013059 [Acer negundo]